jgi:hypothetical protein
MKGLTVNRSAPALYTGDFGDCLGGRSSFTITTFDIAYDATGNKTVVFHFEGTSDIEDESLMCKANWEDCFGKVADKTQCTSLSTHVRRRFL